MVINNLYKLSQKMCQFKTHSLVKNLKLDSLTAIFKPNDILKDDSPDQIDSLLNQLKSSDIKPYSILITNNIVTIDWTSYIESYITATNSILIANEFDIYLRNFNIDGFTLANASISFNLDSANDQSEISERLRFNQENFSKSAILIQDARTRRYLISA